MTFSQTQIATSNATVQPDMLEKGNVPAKSPEVVTEKSVEENEKLEEHVQFTDNTKDWNPAEHQRGRRSPLSSATSSKSPPKLRLEGSSSPGGYASDEGYLSSSSISKRRKLLQPPLSAQPYSAGASKAQARFRTKVKGNIEFLPSGDASGDGIAPRYFPSTPPAAIIIVPERNLTGDYTPDKPSLSIFIPDIDQPVEHKKRSAVPQLLSPDAASDDAQGQTKTQSHSLPGSPYELVSALPVDADDEMYVETPSDVGSPVEPVLIPVSIRKRHGDDDGDEAYLSDPGSSMPYSAAPYSAYTPIYRSPIVKKVYPKIQRGREAPFPTKPIRKGETASAVDSKELKETMAARLELLRSRYHDIKLASPDEQFAIKSSLMSPSLEERPPISAMLFP